MGVQRGRGQQLQRRDHSGFTRLAWRGHLLLAALLLVAACGRSRSPGGHDDPRGGSAGSNDGGRAGASGMAPGASGTDSTESAGEGGVATGARGGNGAAPATGGTGTSGTSGQGNSGGTSGAATGGTSSGTGGDAGSSDAGDAGHAGAAALPLPEGCEPRGRTEDDSSCSLGVFCDGVPNLTNCQRLETGKYQCSCELAHNDRTYELDGAPGIEACAVAAGLCSQDELELGDEACIAVDAASHEHACNLELRCATPIGADFAPGVQAELVRYGSANCSRDAGDRPFACGCVAGATGAEYGVLADSGELACRPLVDFCMSGVEPVFDQPTVCFQTDSNEASGVCDLYETCATPMRLTDDVSLARIGPRYASCTASATAGSSCYCSTAAGSFAFDVLDDPVEATCASSILNCNEATSIEAAGETACAPTSQTGGSDFCDADLECLQSASVDGRDIVSRGRLLVYCLRQSAQAPWWCSCASNQDSTIFELGAPGVSSWDACSEAPARCVEEMPVYVGMYGEFVPPPYPLPPAQ